MPEVDTLAVKPREYLPLLWIVFAALLGVSLLCGAAAVGVNDINQAAQAGTPAVGVVDFFVANINTVVAETVVAFSDIVSAPTFTPISTPTLTKTLIPITASATSTKTRRPTSTLDAADITVAPKTKTYTPSATNTPTNTATATYTSTNTPTATYTPTNTPTTTKTPSTTPSATSIPTDTPSNTPVPTDTPMPTDTDTPVPTDTAVPIDTISAPMP
ncbi:MAG: hypothetical protein QM730_24740 [Anaerolineales bacterium]